MFSKEQRNQFNQTFDTISNEKSDKVFATVSDRKFYRLLDRMDGFSIQDPEYKTAMLPNKHSELYKEAEKVWNEIRDLIFSEEEKLSGNPDQLQEANRNSGLEEDFSEKSDDTEENRNSVDDPPIYDDLEEVVPVSRDDEIKGLLELIDFIENKNNLTILFDFIPDEDENTIIGETTRKKYARKILAKSNSNVLLKVKGNVKKPETKFKIKANPARKNRADRNYAATENRVTDLDLDGVIETLSNERKDAAIEALKYFASYIKIRNNCTISINCSKQQCSVFRNTTLKELYKKVSSTG